MSTSIRFNPRLIEWLSTYEHLRDVGPDGYRAHMLAVLESPEGIWGHAFRNQISSGARHILLSFYTLGERIDIVDLEPAFISLHRHCAGKYHLQTAPGDFRRSLQELDRAFLSYSSGHASYLNPSIREFVASAISSDRETVQDLLASAVRFKQITNLWQLSDAFPGSELRKLLMSNGELFQGSLSRLLYGPAIRWEKMSDGSQRGSPIDMGDWAKIRFLVSVAEVQQSVPLAAMAGRLAKFLTESWALNVVEFSATIGLLETIGASKWVLSHGGCDVYRRLLHGMLAGLIFARAEDWLDLLEFPDKAVEWTDDDEATLSAALKRYREKGVHDDRFERATLDETTELRDALGKLQKKYGLDFGNEIRRLDEDMAEREEDDDRPETGSGTFQGSVPILSPIVTDEDVRQMFSTLGEAN